MNNNPPGRIQIHGDGIGGVTPELVDKRAEEIARMDGRPHAGEQDLIVALEELQNPGPPPPPEADERSNPIELWSTVETSKAHRGVNTTSDDEQTDAEQLFNEGVEEADRDLRLSSTGKKNNV
jgi:hypothetical protein